MTRPSLLIAASLLLAGCATRADDFPSLSPRAAEKIGFAEPVAKPAAPVQPDPVLDARIGALDSQLATIAKGFDADAAIAGRAAGAARGKAVGSEAWITAETALAQLDDWRAQASSLATDAEALATERAASLAPAYPALDALVTRVEAEAGREGTTIEQLQAGLPAA